MPFIPQMQGGTNSIAASSSNSQNLAMPNGAGGDVAIFNSDASNDAFIEFGTSNGVIANVPTDGAQAGGSMLVPHGMVAPMIITLPQGVTFWAVTARAGSPRVTLTRGRWQP
jgi:hypothetical protein